LLLFTGSIAGAGIGLKTDLTASQFAGDTDLEDCLDDLARLTMDASKEPAEKRLVSRGSAVVKLKDALIALSFIGPHKYDLGPHGDSSDPNYDVYDFHTWEAIRAFKRNYNLGAYDWGDVGPGTMRKLDELFRKPRPPEPSHQTGQ
jgi:hypothetical protein